MKNGSMTYQILESHMKGQFQDDDEEITIGVDQTLTQDATGTMVMLELEAMGVQRAKTQLSVQYVDHNITQNDFRNADDHLFLQSMCNKLGIIFSPAGNGISHPLHMSKFLKPGQILIGSDSHTCASGAIGAIAFGMGGIDVARAIAGFSIHIKRPKVLNVYLSGSLPDWVSAKDVALHMLRVYGVKGLRGTIIEYTGDGVKNLSIMDRHVICNMAVETGATCAIFPSDEITKAFLKQQAREEDWVEVSPKDGASYDDSFEITLNNMVPLIARPSSPGNVVEVSQVQGEPIYQAYIGSSANPGFRDFAICASMVEQKRTDKAVSFDINPTSREILENLIESKDLEKLVKAGGRIHQAGCNGCIGMGQAPATGKNSLRTTPRNFKGRSGTPEDSVWLCSPETATASAINGSITDPRKLGLEYKKVEEPTNWIINNDMFSKPEPDAKLAKDIPIQRGPNIKALPIFPRPKEVIDSKIIAKFIDNISTDDILPAGNQILPFRSNLDQLSRFTFFYIYPEYYNKCQEVGITNGHVLIAGENYGQGSSREHAAMAPRYLGLQAIIAKSYARIHRQNLVNFGVIPFEFIHYEDYDLVDKDMMIRIENVYDILSSKTDSLFALIGDKKIPIKANITHREKEIIKSGGLLNHTRAELHL